MEQKKEKKKKKGEVISLGEDSSEPCLKDPMTGRK